MLWGYQIPLGSDGGCARAEAELGGDLDERGCWGGRVKGSNLRFQAGKRAGGRSGGKQGGVCQASTAGIMTGQTTLISGTPGGAMSIGVRCRSHLSHEEGYRRQEGKAEVETMQEFSQRRPRGNAPRS